MDEPISCDVDDRPTRGRRSVLIGGAAAVAGLAIQGGAGSARAASGDPVRLGRRNAATSPTRIANSTEGQTALRARAVGPGAIGLQGVSLGGTGVHGLTRDGDGLSGESVFGIGVSGHSIESGSYAVSGDSTNGVGVQGGSHGGVGVQGNSQFGVAVQGANISETEPAVSGWAQNGQTGIMGRSSAFDDFDSIESPRNVGVFGVADHPGGRGVVARSLLGRALHAKGRVKFSTSGVAVIPGGASEVVISPDFRITTSAKVLVTAQSDPGGATVAFIAVDPEANAFTIHMTEVVLAEVILAWFVLD